MLSVARKAAVNVWKISVYLALRAAWCMALFCNGQVGEVTCPTLAGFDLSRHLHANCVKWMTGKEGRANTARLTLPHNKVNKGRGAKLWLCTKVLPNKMVINPVRALSEHMAYNRPGPAEHLLTYTGNNGRTRRPVTKSWFVDRFNDALRQGGRPRIWGHSSRAGGASSYMLASRDFERIQLIGRWRSDAWQRYIKNRGDLAARYLANTVIVDVCTKGLLLREDLVEVGWDADVEIWIATDLVEVGRDADVEIWIAT